MPHRVVGNDPLPLHRLWLHADGASFVLQPLAPALDTLANASDAGSFHAAMETVFTPAETIVTSVAGLLGKNMNLAGRGNAQNGYGDYGDMMMGGYESEMMNSDDIDANYRGQNYGQNYGQPQGGRQ